MELKERSVAEVTRAVLEDCRLSGDQSLLSREALSTLVRRAAGFLCPCPPSALVKSVVAALDGLVPADAEVVDSVETAVDALSSLGDLVERKVHRDSGFGADRALVYLGPPSFVERAGGVILILGIAPDSVPTLPTDLERDIERTGYIRRFGNGTSETIDALLAGGYRRLSDRAWLSIPRSESASEHSARAHSELAILGPSGPIPGLRIIDSATPPRFYRGRWLTPKRHTGCYVGRRPQAFGADLWCFVELLDGEPVRLLDFPPMNSTWRGCDHAWRLQAAIDYELGQPQRFSIRESMSDREATVDFFSPVPAWAERRWSFLGASAPAERCLFSFRFELADLDEEVQFMKNDLWLFDSAEGVG
jgi:hypothetical protein